jgi:hypothetical protein
VSVQEATPPGWFVAPKIYKYYRYLTGHEPPRPFAIWAQLRNDAVHWQMIVLWLSCGWLISGGAATNQWSEVALGSGLILFWLVCLVSVASRIRTSPLVFGVISSYSRHWQFGMSKAMAVMADGREIAVVVQTSLVSTFVSGGRRGLALFLDEFKPGAGGYCLVVAMRAMPEGSFGEGTNEVTASDPA